MTTKLEEFKESYSNLEHCCLKDDAKALIARTVEVTHFVESENGEGNDEASTGAAVVKLDDGTFAVFQEWQDYTGHGCQCDCWAESGFATLEEAIAMGLDDDGRTALGLSVPE